MTNPDDTSSATEKPAPQVSPGKPGDEPDTSKHEEKDRIPRGDDDDQHRQ